MYTRKFKYAHTPLWTCTHEKALVRDFTEGTTQCAHMIELQVVFEKAALGCKYDHAQRAPITS
eukprot:2882469-Pleurochrysis_carterae.AAC.2